MVCLRCKSYNIQAISDTYGSIKPRGFLASIAYIISGLWILGLLRSGSRGTIQTSVKFVCMNCGYSFGPPIPKHLQKRSFFESIGLVIFLLLVFPPMGAIPLWLSKKYEISTKIILTVIFSTFYIYRIVL